MRSSPVADQNADAWDRLAERSRILVQHASRLMKMLARPDRTAADLQATAAAEAALALAALADEMAAHPELAAHLHTLQRFDHALAGWSRSVDGASPLVSRYQAALLQQAAQVVASCLHVGSLSASESARLLVLRRAAGAPAGPPPP